MTREEAIFELSLVKAVLLDPDFNSRAVKAIDMAIKALSQPPADQWIPCSSGELPRQGEQVIGTFENDNGDMVAVPCIYMPQMLTKPWPLIAWMPLPEPYKEN